MSGSDSDSSHEALRSELSSIITGVESSVASPSTSATTAPEDDYTPFPSPVLSATRLAGLSLGEDGELEEEVDDDKVITEEDKTKALELKAQANKAFAAKEFNKSIDLYTQAIALNPKESTFWNNRAMSKAKMEEHGAAISDATKAVSINPSYAKAYYRRGLSYLAILRPTDSVPDLKKALSIEPNNRVIREQLNTVVKLIRRIEFEKAISVGDSETASQRCLALIDSGACTFDPASAASDMPLPTIPSDPLARYTPTKEFVEGMIESFKKGGKIPKRVAWEIILGCKEQVEKEKSLVEIEIPEGVTCDIIGDTHGQFFDVCNLLSMTSPPSENHYLVFNGDLVDRGSWSVEVALTAFAYKWLYPNYVFINRGNHETNDMNKVYGFEGECKAKLGEMTFKLFADVFTMLPLAVLLSASLPPTSPKSEGSKPAILHEGKRRFFICHGGPPVSKDGVTLEEVSKLERFGRQPGQEGVICEMLWTDPQEPTGRGPSKRGVGLGFGPDVTRRWCELNNITAVIRSHEVRADGYAIEHDGLCITVFSCPNYCDSTGNKAAYIRMQANGALSYHQFDAVPHPDVKPMAYSSGFNQMGF
ncbi:hypothetical protein L202_06735 [Cryptococcus amylolentus CBS 6039]|uniref:Serine/threonine-protein phosphatase n=1 Tax=Cryptococcus amylolentus CBS 6039 TaxID=1295533 RepID=A0A1E3HDB1_9TREE|nr:hypothetical protein L202_06735 [Cryptococcus amylolentus CBS 6039]ODN74317.1 hypothetical protein L202_06735 [Cryptococcus amylolentus CBS 6039]